MNAGRFVRVGARFLSLLGWGFLFVSGTAIATPDEAQKLWYATPAKSWEKEALPLGNGRLGCMVFGGIHEERIQFNEDSLWLGDEKDTGMYQAFGDVLIRFDGGSGQALPENPSKHVTAGHQGVAMTADGRADTKWCMEHQGRTIVWTKQAEGVVQSYRLTSGNDVPSRDPREWKLFGSVDGTEWVLLDDQKLNAPFSKRGMEREFKFENERSYRSYKFEFAPHDKTHFQVAEISLGSGGELPSGVEDYRRKLDVSNAIHQVSYQLDEVRYDREYFASRPAEALVFRLTADKKGAYSGKVNLRDAHVGKLEVHGDTMVIRGALKGMRPGGKKRVPYDVSLEYEAQLRILHEGGELTAEGDEIIFKDCDSLTLLLVADTDYLNQRDKAWKGEHPHERISAQLAAASNLGFDGLKAAHVADYQSLFDRMSLDLGETPEDVRSLPTDERLTSYRGVKK